MDDGRDPLIGRTVAGRFHVEQRIAAGGMGVVYRAMQQPLGRPVALKILRQPQDARLDEIYRERFLREAAVMARLNHPHTVVVYDYGDEGPHLYFAMEYLEGNTLTQHLHAGGPMPPPDVAHVARQIASSLGDAHQQGLVHRDLKPGNVMICPRGGDRLFTKVLDFGLVKMVSSEEAKKLTAKGILMGSPRYMAPEQVKAHEGLDARADIYSFGALMTFMLTGKPPFPEGAAFEAMRHHVHTAPPALRTLLPQCTASAELERLVLRCLAKSPDERWPSMGDLMDGLAECPEMASVISPSGFPRPMSTPISQDQPPLASLAPGPARPVVQEDSSVSQLGRAWFRRADGSSLSGTGWALRGLAAVTIILIGAAAAVFVPRWGSPSSVQTIPLPPRGSSSKTPLDDEVAMNAAAATVVQLSSDPPGAIVEREGALVGSTPLEIAVPAGEAWTVTVELAHHVLERVRIDGSQQMVNIPLRPAEEPFEEGGDRARRRRVRSQATPDDDIPQSPTGRVLLDPWNPMQ